GEVAADHDLVVGEAEPLAQLAGKAAVEQSLDRGLIGVAADEIGGAARSAQQAQSLQDNALAGTGLAGEDVEAGVERQRQVVDDGEVADPQLTQHGGRVRCSAVGSHRGGAGAGLATATGPPPCRTRAGSALAPSQLAAQNAEIAA